MSTKAIIFDKDGTLIDFDSFWVEVSRHAIKTILNKTGMNTVSTDEILEALGVENGVTRIDGVLCWGTYGQLGDAIAKALSLHGYNPNGDDLAAITREAYNLAGDKGKVTATCDDVIGTLTELKKRGIILAVVTADGLLIVLGQRLQGGGTAGLRLHGGDEVDEFFRLLPGDNGTDRHLGVVHGAIDDAVLMPGLQKIVLPVLVLAETRLADLLHAAHACGAVYHQVSGLKHE